MPPGRRCDWNGRRPGAAGLSVSPLHHASTWSIPPPRRATRSADRRSKKPEHGRGVESPQSISAARNCCLVVLLLRLSGNATIRAGSHPVQRIYLDHNATTPVLPAVVDAHDGRAAGGVRQPVERPPFRAAGQGRDRRGPERRGGADRRRSVGSGLHQRRHRRRQLRHPRRCRGARAVGTAPPHRDDHRARGGAQHLEGAGQARLDGPRCSRWTRPASSRPTRCETALRGRHRARVGHAREQRDRHHPADRRAGAARPRARRAVSTPTPCSRPARSRST